MRWIHQCACDHNRRSNTDIDGLLCERKVSSMRFPVGTADQKLSISLKECHWGVGWRSWVQAGEESGTRQSDPAGDGLPSFIITHKCKGLLLGIKGAHLHRVIHFPEAWLLERKGGGWGGGILCGPNTWASGIKRGNLTGKKTLTEMMICCPLFENVFEIFCTILKPQSV